MVKMRLRSIHPERPLVVLWRLMCKGVNLHRYKYLAMSARYLFKGVIATLHYEHLRKIMRKNFLF